MKMLRIRNAAILALLLTTVACKTTDPVLVPGQVGVGLADGIHELQKGTAALSPNPIPATKARTIQVALLKANEDLSKLPDFLEAADAARKVGQVEPGKVEETLAIVASISDQLNIVVQGLDVGEAAKAMLKLAAETRVTAAKIMSGLAELKAAANKE